MCLIVISRSAEAATSIAEEHRARGSGAWSTAAWSATGCCVDGGVDGRVRFAAPEADLYLVHLQAATALENSTQPVTTDLTLFWHNGLLFPRTIQHLQSDLGVSTSFDTELLAIARLRGYDLGDIAGSFACVEYNRTTNDLLIFSNDLVPFYLTGDRTTLLTARSAPPATLVMSGTVYVVLPAADGTLQLIPTRERFKPDAYLPWDLDV